MGSNPSPGLSRMDKYPGAERNKAVATPFHSMVYPQFGDFFIVNYHKLYFYFIFVLEKFYRACVVIETFIFICVFL